MGCGGTKKAASPPDPPPDVEGDLLTYLVKLARKQITELGGDPLTWNHDSFDQLQIELHKMASILFQNRYKYDFDDDRTKCHPQHIADGTQCITTVAGICNMDPSTANADSVKNFINVEIFSGADLPGWVKDTAKADFVGVVVPLLNPPKGDMNWQSIPYNETFEAQAEDEHSIKNDTILLYVNVSLTEDGINAALTIIYFMTVIYYTASDRQETRDTLIKTAYASAQSYTQSSTITSFGQLEDALETYATNKFADLFGFDYNSANPPELNTGSAITIAHNELLGYIPDKSTARVEDFVKEQFFSAIDINEGDPGPDNVPGGGGGSIQSDPLNNSDVIKQMACADLLAQVDSLFQNASTNNWDYEKFSGLYYPPDPTKNPVKSWGLIVYYYNHATTNSKDTISVTYIYIIGMYYEMESLNTILDKDLFKEIINNLAQDVRNYAPPAKDTYDDNELAGILKTYARQVFQDTFDYSFDTKPPKAGKIYMPYEGWIRVADYPATTDQLTDSFQTVLFGPDNPKFPEPSKTSHLRQDIYDKSFKAVNLWAGTSTPKGANLWYSDHSNPVFALSPTRNFQAEIVGIYATAIKAERDASVKNIYVYFLGMYSGIPADSIDDW